MSIRIDDHSREFINAKDLAIERAMNAIGIHLEREAKDELENSPRRVDTSRLKASITYATEMNHTSGEAPASGGDFATHATPEKGTVYVGTNVEYAAYVHEGTQRLTPNRYLKKAFSRNEKQIKEYLKRELKGE